MRQKRFSSLLALAAFAFIVMLLVSGCNKRTVEEAGTENALRQDKPAETLGPLTGSVIGTPSDAQPSAGRNTAPPPSRTGGPADTQGSFVNPYADQNSTCPSGLALINDECCVDSNNNTACDKYEQRCGDGVCSPDENRCSCAQDCGSCETQTAPGLCQMYTCENSQCVVKKDPVCCGDLICTPQESCDGCFVDCCSLNPVRANLKTYPKWAEKMSTVLGDRSNSIDVITAADIESHLALANLTAGDGKLASEVDLRLRDYIVVGNPCTNPALVPLLADKIYANSGNCQIFAPGDALLKIVPISNVHVALVVGGFSPRDAQRAGNVLVNYSNYDLDGREFAVGGTHPDPTITKIR